MSEAEKISSVVEIMKKTEEIDVDFLLNGLAQSGSIAYRRNLVRYFRNQIINVALGTAIPLRNSDSGA